ncbi:hypothetical protein, partial [Xenorhabdus bovienii]|uniref:hypothetical protein n=3 Tax=Xenorhabdus bovienii TaxID=40576 RepID=UPI003DA689FA
GVKLQVIHRTVITRQPDVLQALMINRRLAIDAKPVAIVNKKTDIFGEKAVLLNDLTRSLAMDVYPVLILRDASQRLILVMESCAGWR